MFHGTLRLFPISFSIDTQGERCNKVWQLPITEQQIVRCSWAEKPEKGLKSWFSVPRCIHQLQGFDNCDQWRERGLCLLHAISYIPVDSATTVLFKNVAVEDFMSKFQTLSSRTSILFKLKITGIQFSDRQLQLLAIYRNSWK